MCACVFVVVRVCVCVCVCVRRGYVFRGAISLIAVTGMATFGFTKGVSGGWLGARCA
jgi:hypothetical protein